MRDTRRILRDCGAGKLLPKELLAFMEDFTVEDASLRVDRSGSEHVCIKAFASIQGTLVRIEVDHARRAIECRAPVDRVPGAHVRKLEVEMQTDDGSSPDVVSVNCNGRTVTYLRAPNG